MNNIYRSICHFCQIDCSSSCFCFNNRRTAYCVIVRTHFAFSNQLLCCNINHVSVLSVNHDGNSGLFALKQSLQNSIIVSMEELSLVSHEELHCRIACVCKLRNLFDYFRSWVSHYTVESVVDHCDAVSICFAIVFDGFYKAFAFFLVNKFNECSSATYCSCV